MTALRPDEELEDAVTRKAERLRRGRSRSTIWVTLARVVGLGWVLVVPLVLGATGGRLLARWLGLPSLALVGLLAGLLVGLVGVYQQLTRAVRETERENAGESGGKP